MRYTSYAGCSTLDPNSVLVAACRGFAATTAPPSSEGTSPETPSVGPAQEIPLVATLLGKSRNTFWSNLSCTLAQTQTGRRGGRLALSRVLVPFFQKIRPVGRPSSTKQTVLHDCFCKVVLQLRYLPLETPCCRDVFAWFSSTAIELKITLILGHVAYATPGQD